MLAVAVVRGEARPQPPHRPRVREGAVPQAGRVQPGGTPRGVRAGGATRIVRGAV